MEIINCDAVMMIWNGDFLIDDFAFVAADVMGVPAFAAAVFVVSIVIVALLNIVHISFVANVSDFKINNGHSAVAQCFSNIFQ